MAKQKIQIRDDGRPNFVESFIKAAISLAENTDKMSGDPTQECIVEFRINGVDCPFVEVLHELEKDATQHVEERAKEIGSERLETVSSSLDELVQNVERCFEDFKAKMLAPND